MSLVLAKVEGGTGILPDPTCDWAWDGVTCFLLGIFHCRQTAPDIIEVVSALQ